MGGAPGDHTELTYYYLLLTYQVITREPELQARLQGAPAQEGRGGFDAAGRGLTTLRWSPLDEAQVRAELLGAGSAGDGRYVLYEVVDTHV